MESMSVQVDTILGPYKLDLVYVIPLLGPDEPESLPLVFGAIIGMIACVLFLCFAVAWAGVTVHTSRKRNQQNKWVSYIVERGQQVRDVVFLPCPVILVDLVSSGGLSLHSFLKVSPRTLYPRMECPFHPRVYTTG